MNDRASVDQTKSTRKPRLSPQEKVAALKAQLAAAEAEAKEAELTRAMIVGRHVIAAMRDDAEFASRIVALLRERVKNARDRAAIAPLMI